MNLCRTPPPPPHPPVIKICGWGPWDIRAIFLNAGEEQGACYLKFNQFCQQIIIIHSFINPYNHSVVKVLVFFVEEGGIILLSNYVSPFRSYTFVHLSSWALFSWTHHCDKDSINTVSSTMNKKYTPCVTLTPKSLSSLSLWWVRKI